MLKDLQAALPRLWTDELYTEEFRKNPAKHRDFQHALAHVSKAVGQLWAMVELGDHGVPSQHNFPNYEVEKYLADLVICAVRLAVTNPSGEFDLEAAVLRRVERKMGVRLSERTEPRRHGDDVSDDAMMG